MYWLETAHDGFGWNVLFCTFVRTASVLSVGYSAVQLVHLPIAVERSIFPKAQMHNYGRLSPSWEDNVVKLRDSIFFLSSRRMPDLLKVVYSGAADAYNHAVDVYSGTVNG
jgi:hypothetical protein